MTNVFGGYGQSKESKFIDYSLVVKTKVTRPANATADNLVLIKDATGEIKDGKIAVGDLVKRGADLDMDDHTIKGIKQDYPPRDYSEVATWETVARVTNNKLDVRGGRMDGLINMNNNKITGLPTDPIQTDDSQAVSWGQVKNIAKKSNSLLTDINMNGHKIKGLNLEWPIHAEGGEALSYLQIKLLVEECMKNTPTIITVWAEETGTLQRNTFEWSFGNGSSGGTHRHAGYPMSVRGEIIRMAVSSVQKDGKASGVIAVGLGINGEFQSDDYKVVKPAGKKSAYVFF